MNGRTRRKQRLGLSILIIETGTPYSPFGNGRDGHFCVPIGSLCPLRGLLLKWYGFGEPPVRPRTLGYRWEANKGMHGGADSAGQ